MPTPPAPEVCTVEPHVCVSPPEWLPEMRREPQPSCCGGPGAATPAAPAVCGNPGGTIALDPRLHGRRTPARSPGAVGPASVSTTLRRARVPMLARPVAQLYVGTFPGRLRGHSPGSQGAGAQPGRVPPVSYRVVRTPAFSLRRLGHHHLGTGLFAVRAQGHGRARGPRWTSSWASCPPS